MIYVHSGDEGIDKLVKRFCAPLFATTEFLQGGHNESTTSATVTFVRYQGKIYAVTCHHVLSAFFAEAIRTKQRIAPAIHSGKTVRQFASYSREGKYRWSFLSCRDFPEASDIDSAAELDALDRANADRPDIAIADITEVWHAVQENRDAESIDLDAWVEPDWSVVQPVWVAYGFPNGHKSLVQDKVAAPMPRVAVELASSLPSIERPTYVLCSTLEIEHGWGFSGLSGGPVLVAHNSDDRYAFVGLTFEGSPSSKDPEQNAEAFLGKSDIVLRGYHLTPHAFKEWLSNRKFGVELV
ncbi:MAG: hypothetical protein JNN30_06275 [Rhodanobacteraceae bacterium]|nr:hypothetical protein [Rhodanobacteraceae bacterium]